MGRPSDPNAAAEQEQAAAQSRLEAQNKRIQQQRIENIRRGSGAPSILPIIPGATSSGKPGSVSNTFGQAAPAQSLFSKTKLGS